MTTGITDASFPKKSINKFGIIGTSCAGKTTLAHALVSRLKSYGLLADGLFSQDRKFSFDLQFLATEEAQNWMVTNLVAQEVNLSLRADVDILITDRTPLDLFAYYAVQYDTALSRACFSYVQEWMKTYKAVFYLPPLPYQADNKRPSDDFRLSVDKKLTELMVSFPNVRTVERQHVLTSILEILDFKKPTAKHLLAPADCQAIANTFRLPVVLKASRDTDILSDSDVWLLSEDPLSVNVLEIESYMRQLFGAYVNFDLGVARDTSTFDFEYSLLEPQ